MTNSNTTSASTTTVRPLSTMDALALTARATLAITGFIPVTVRAVGAAIQAFDETKCDGRLQSANLMDLGTGSSELHDFIVHTVKDKTKDYLGSEARKAHIDELRKEFSKPRPQAEEGKEEEVTNADKFNKLQSILTPEQLLLLVETTAKNPNTTEEEMIKLLSLTSEQLIELAK